MTADQLSLLSVPATRGASRASDPATARDAGRSMSGHVLRDQQRTALCGLIDVCRRSDGGTAYEVFTHLNGAIKSESIVAKRLSELRADGLVHVTDDRRPGSSHRLQMVHVPTEAARDLLARGAA